MSALYIHVPFCRNKCGYCAFVSITDGGPVARYVTALRLELSNLNAENLSPLTTLFIGGGTPTVLPIAMLVAIIADARKIFTFAEDAEISVEANPGTVDEETLTALIGAGVNRLSLGVQSLDDRELRLLGRIHSAGQARSAVQAARKAGFANINLDLMFGIPGQSTASWQETLDTALSLAPEHLSVYQLAVEEGTPYARLQESGDLTLPGEEDILDMDRRTVESCHSAGIFQYEISNFAQPGFGCRHNLNYWQNGEYYGCGASAVSYLRGVREKRTPDVLDYIRRVSAGGPAVIESECLSLESSFRETVIMGLRLMCGVSREFLRCRFGWDVDHFYGHTLEHQLSLGLVELTDTHLRLSARGRPLANRVMAELV